MRTSKKPLHPMQPVVNDGRGVHRFKENAIVRFLLDAGPFDLNYIALEAAHGRFSEEDQEQLAQLIGYSVSGAADLEYVSDRVCARARRASEKLHKQETADADPAGTG